MRIARNILALGIGQFFTWASSAVLVYLLPKYLDGADYGRLAVAFTLIAFIGPLADLGSTSLLMRDTPRLTHPEASVVLSNILVMRVPATLASSAVGILCISFLTQESEARLLFIAFLPGLVCQAFSGCISGVLRGIQDMAPTALADVVGRGSGLLLTAGLLLQGYGPVSVAIASDVGAVLSLAILLFSLHRKIGLSNHLDLTTWRTILASGIPFFVAGLAVAFHGKVDILILSRLAGVTVAGWYAVAYSIITIPVFVPSILAGAFFPAIAEGYRSPGQVASLTRRCLQLVLLGTLPIALGISALSSEIMEALSYGDKFRNAAPLITILALHMPFVGVNMVIATAIYSLGGEKKWMKLMIQATALDIGLNLLFIPVAEHVWGNGAIASAVITVSTEVFICLVGIFMLPAYVLGRAEFRNAARFAASSLVMVIVVLSCRNSFIAVPIFLGAFVYGMGVVLTGAVSVNDVRATLGFINGRLHKKTVSLGAP